MKFIFLVVFGVSTLFAQNNSPVVANRVVRGTGTPSSTLCTTSADVGKVYIRTDAGAVQSSFYSCDNTGVGTFAWELGGGGSSAVPGGSDNQIQYNNAGAFGGMAGSAWTNSTRLLKLLDANGNNIFNFIADPAGDPSCGGILYINCDAATPPSVSGATGTPGGLIELDAVQGGNTSIATTGTGGSGGGVFISGANGGVALSAATASTGGAGGLVSSVSGNGAGASTANSANTGGNGGDAELKSGQGGAAGGSGTAVNIGGNGGNILIVAQVGAAAASGAMNTGGNAGHIYALLNTGGTGSTANGVPGEFKVNAANGDSIGTDVFTVSRAGLAKSTLYGTMTNCADSAGAAACGAAPAGSFVIDAGSTATIVSTTAVTANSQIFLQEDSSLSTRLSVTCNTQSSLTLGALRVTARTAATSFTATLEVAPTTNPMCVNYYIIN